MILFDVFYSARQRSAYNGLCMTLDNLDIFHALAIVIFDFFLDAI